MLAEIQQRLQTQPQQWLKSLQQDQGMLANQEQEIHGDFARMADRLVAGLLAQTTAGVDFADTAKRGISRRSAPATAVGRRTGGRSRVRLLGGLLLWVTTLYCSPALRTGKKRGREGSGLYPELAILGIQEGKSPALVREVGRLAALLPSYEAVQHELAERGMNLNIKEVHGIGQYAAQAALTFRKRELELYRAGKLPAADGRGKRFGAMIDGGRTKIRKTKRQQKGRGKSKTQKRRYQTDWREPKQIIVFEMDEQGRMKKGSKPILDGTFQGPDEILEVLAMRLHQVGASQAGVVAFRADGAPWIWERLKWVTGRLGLKKSQVSLGLIMPRGASCQLGVGVVACLEKGERPRVFKKLRKWLAGGASQAEDGPRIDRSDVAGGA